MSRVLNSFNVILLIVCSLTFCSCLTVDRNIKINMNGSGEETIKITFLKEFYSMMSSMTSMMDSTRKTGFLDSLYSDQIFLNKSKDRYDSVKGIKVLDMSSSGNQDSSQSFIIKYEFDSIQKIGNSFNQLGENEDKSETHVSLGNEKGNLVFRYDFEQPVPQEIPKDDSLTEQMKTGISQIFGSGYIKFEIEFPAEVISSNATSANGNTLTWNYPVSEIFLKGKMNLEAIMKEN